METKQQEGNIMSTIEDFENAPIGATATDPRGRKAVKMAFDAGRWELENGWALGEYGMCKRGFTLDPAPAPATAQEALDLVWGLAHPIKEGQEVPIGTECIAKVRDGEYMTYRSLKPFDGVSRPGWAEARTLDPLPEPEPDWLDAPAVMAHAEDEEPHVWVNVDAQGWRDEHGHTRRWTALRDVDPLYPKGQDA